MIVSGCITKKQPGIPETTKFIFATELSENNMRQQLRKKFHKLVNAVWKNRLTLNSTVSATLLKRELAPSAANIPVLKSLPLWRTPNRISFLEVANCLTGNPVSGKLACKFAFFLHFLNTIFSALILAFSLPSQLCEMGAHCTMLGRGSFYFQFKYNVIQGCLLIRDEKLWRMSKEEIFTVGLDSFSVSDCC